MPTLPTLTITGALPDLALALAHGRRVVLEAPPGAGKSTLVPLALLEAPWRGDGRIVMLEPRRLAARAAARRMASTLGEPVGRTVGYRVRFDTRVSGATRIEVVTEGVLTRLRQDDPSLEGIGLVIFDEFHERSIHADLALALCMDVRKGLRPDLKVLVMMPGITHWQHPSFFAYFPANSSKPSVLAEMLTATLGAQCMLWQTSPAAAELEERMMQWLGQILGLPQGFEGVIQDTASTATLCSILTAREKDSSFQINERGFDNTKYRLYCSTETHSSIEKAVKIAGFGRASLRKIPVDDAFAMIPSELERAITHDKASGYVPLCVVATIGTTGSTAIDPIRAIGEICKRQHGRSSICTAR